MKETKIRPKVTDNPLVGKERADAYKSAINRYHEAFDAGFYVECVALIEGLIADRIESLANQIDGIENKSYKPLGIALDRLDKIQNQLDDEIKGLLDELKKWKDKRNKCIHELPKVQPNITETFEERYENVMDCATEGMELFRKIDNAIRKFRR